MATFEGLAPGRHSFRLVVTSGSESATAERADLIRICPFKTHVNTTGSGVFPYATPETATNSLSEAFKAVWKASAVTTRVEVATGGYTLDKTIALATPVEIIGAGAGATFLNASPASPRAFFLNHDGAVLDSIAVTNTRAIASGCGALMARGVIRNCRFAYCQNILVNSCNGAGVNMSGGRLEATEIDHCTANNTYSCANALYISGGVATGCDFHHCDGGYSHGNPDFGSAIVQITGGLLEKTRVHDNTRGTIAGIYQKGGTVANCLVYGNTASSFSAGIYKTAGDTYYCTFHGNVVNGDTTGCSGVHQTGGISVNNIFYGNGPAGGTFGSCYVTGGTFNTNVIDVAITYGTGNSASDPQFEDGANADFHLSTRASPAVGTATPLELFTDDFDGTPRAAPPSIGAFEYDDSGEEFGAGITVLQTDYLVGTPVPLAGVALGADPDEVTFAWYLDGSTTVASTEQNPTFHDLALGRHSVRLVVTRGSETAEANRPDLIVIRPLTVYVNNTGSGVYVGGGNNTPCMESCTIANNRTVTDANGNAAIHQASGRVLNNIIYDNGPEGAAGSGCHVEKGVFTTNCLAAPLDGYPLNLVADPLFLNPARGDYHLRQHSPVIDQGDNQPWMAGAGDLDGLPRLHRGGRVDLGCYESPCRLGTIIVVR